MRHGYARPYTAAIARTPLILSLGSCLVLGACAGGPGLPTTDFLQTASTGAQAGASTVHTPGNDLRSATLYWGKKYAESPTSLEAALAYSKNLKALGEKRKALAVLQQASVFHGNNRDLAGEYGRLALSLGQVAAATKVLAIADDPAKPDWRIISARGTALAKQSKFSEAVPLFERALTLSQNHPSVLNNLALAHAMNGEPATAETLLRQATTNGAEAKKVRQNLALVLGLQGKYEEAAQVAARDLTMAQAQQRVAQIRQMVKLAPVAPETQPAVASLANAGAWSTETSLKPTNTAVAPSGAIPSTIASR
ncbi:MAG: tetratricopeptide repeat protein [Pseudomonadota bacterium]